MSRQQGWYVTVEREGVATMLRYWTAFGYDRGYWSAPCYEDDPDHIKLKARETYGETQDIAPVRAYQTEPTSRVNQQTADAAFLEQLSDIMWEGMSPRALRLREIARRIASGFYHG